MRLTCFYCEGFPTDSGGAEKREQGVIPTFSGSISHINLEMLTTAN
jgi:hypothetical protein